MSRGPCSGHRELIRGRCKVARSVIGASFLAFDNGFEIRQFHGGRRLGADHLFGHRCEVPCHGLALGLFPLERSLDLVDLCGCGCIGRLLLVARGLRVSDFLRSPRPRSRHLICRGGKVARSRVGARFLAFDGGFDVSQFRGGGRLGAGQLLGHRCEIPCHGLALGPFTLERGLDLVDLCGCGCLGGRELPDDPRDVAGHCIRPRPLLVAGGQLVPCRREFSRDGIRTRLFPFELRLDALQLFRPWRCRCAHPAVGSEQNLSLSSSSCVQLGKFCLDLFQDLGAITRIVMPGLAPRRRARCALRFGGRRRHRSVTSLGAAPDVRG